MKPKAFDCVTMKRRAQAAIQAAYEAQRSRFGSFAEFLNAPHDEPDWIKALRAKAVKS